jgi:hypothetical protein
VFANRLRVTATAALLAIAFTVNGSVARTGSRPRAYGNALVDLNFVIGGYGFADGAVATDAQFR